MGNEEILNELLGSDQGSSEEKASNITFFQKNPINCPICNTEFRREELRSGGGRLIAGKLTNELRRRYQENKKYGVIIPLIYPIVVCPNCFYSAFPEDFLKMNESAKQMLESTTTKLFPQERYRIRKRFVNGLQMPEKRWVYDFYILVICLCSINKNDKKVY